MALSLSQVEKPSGRGLLVVVEGCVKAGKSRFSKKLAKSPKLWNTGRVERMAFPDCSTATGMLLDDYLRGRCKLSDRAAHTLFSANRREMYEKMRQKMLDGVTLVVERYVHLGIPYTYANSCTLPLPWSTTSADGCDPIEWCCNADRGQLRPDVVFLVEVDDKTLRRRLNVVKLLERYETTDFQKRVQEILLNIVSYTWATMDVQRVEYTSKYFDLAAEIVAKKHKQLTDTPLTYPI